MDCATIREEALAVLYGEADLETRERVAGHHAECPTCRDEYAALVGVRATLQAWRLPDSLSAARPAARRPRPVWPGLVAAAGLLLALGAAVRLAGASLEVQKGPIAFRIGTASELATLRAELAAHEQRHRQELASLRAAFEAQAASRRDDEALLSRVAEMIRVNDRRNSELFDARLATFNERAEAQRRYDMARIGAGLSYLDGKSGQHFARTTELMGYVLQASQKK